MNVRKATLMGLAALAAAIPAASADELPARVFAVDPRDEVQAVVLFGESKPAFLRLEIRVGEEPFRSAWAEFVERLHQFLDDDHDGVLTAKEAQRGNWPQLLRNPFNGQQPSLEQRIMGRLGSLHIDSSPRDGQVSFDELSRYLREALSFPELGVQTGPAGDTRALEAFNQLDRDGDGALSEAELTGAIGLMARLDRDGDEKIGLDEIRPDLASSYRQFIFAQQPGPAPGPDTAPIAALRNESDRSTVMRRLLRMYDRANGHEGSGKDLRLSPGELGLPAEAIQPFDRNQDGVLEALELEEFLTEPPAGATVAVRLAQPGQAGPGRKPVEITLTGYGASSWRVSESPDGRIQLDLGDSLLSFRASDGLQNYKATFEQQFQAADSDNNGYLEQKEAQQNFFINQVFASADRDGDGKLFRKELDAYVERLDDAQRSQTTLSVSDRGRPLFELLDTNHDQALGIRELRGALERLGRYLKPGTPLRSEGLPRRYEIGFARGPNSVQEGIRIETYDSSALPTPPASRNAPLWFQRMDRNRDGDVSQREFLGPLDTFRRLDANGDGLIDPEEAAQR
jgi:Ca2+-binding EF-hand superfamily protein